MGKNTLRHRTAANIPVANKKHLYHGQKSSLSLVGL
jgi:hypothetical protein